MACNTQLSAADICDIVKLNCPHLKSVMCVPSLDGQTLALVGIDSTGSQSDICEFRVGLTEDQICDIVAAKIPEFPDVLTEDDVCSLLDEKAVLKSELCTMIAETCPHVKDVQLVNGSLVVSYTDNVSPARVIPLPQSTSVTVDGITTTTHPDGTTHRSCDNPIKSGVYNGDHTWTFTKQNGGTVTVRDTFATLVDNGDGTATIEMPNGRTKQIVCAPLPADVRVVGIRTEVTTNEDESTSTDLILDMSDGTTLNGGPVIDRDLFASVVPDNGDGTGSVTDANDNTLTVCLRPVKDVRLNEDRSHTVVYQDGTDGVTIPAPLEPTSAFELADGGSNIYDDAGTINPLKRKNGQNVNVLNQSILTDADFQGGGIAFDSTIHRVMMVDDNDVCRVGRLVCRNGDTEGTINIAGLQFEVVGNKDRHTLNDEQNVAVFTTGDEAGTAFYDLVQYDFEVVTCGNSKQINFTGAISLTLHSTLDIEQRVILNLQHSIDGGAFAGGFSPDGQMTWTLGEGERIVEEVLGINQWANLSAGPHSILFRVVMNGISPGPALPADTEIRIQSSRLNADLGDQLRCC